MPKKPLKSLKLETPKKFEDYLAVLWDELYWANWHYNIFKETGRLCQQHEAVFNQSAYFWHFTLRAHCQTALVYLHRVYDQNAESFCLHRFLLTVRDNHQIFEPAEVRRRRSADPHADDLIQRIGRLDLTQLECDIVFSSDANPKVANLKRWRDRVTFHKDERELFRQKPFEADYPLPFVDIEDLIASGFQILNRYSQYFDTTVRSEGCREWKDVKFLFERDGWN